MNICARSLCVRPIEILIYCASLSVALVGCSESIRDQDAPGDGSTQTAQVDLSKEIVRGRYARTVEGIQSVVDVRRLVSDGGDTSQVSVVLEWPGGYHRGNAVHVNIYEDEALEWYRFDNPNTSRPLQYLANSLRMDLLDDGSLCWSLMYEVTHEYVGLDPFLVSVGVVVDGTDYAIHGEIPSNAHNFPDRWWEFFRLRPNPAFATEQPEAYAVAVERWEAYAELWLRRHEKYARKEEGIALPPSDFELIDSQRNSTVF